MDLQASVLAMSSREMRAYVYHYVDIENVMNGLLHKATRGEGFCRGCAAIVRDDDVGADDCPCSFDWFDYACEKWYVVDHYLPYLIQADLLLREELGDVYTVGE